MHPRLVKGAHSDPVANVHGPPVMIQPSSTRLARPRDAGKWLDPATRGPTHSGAKTSSSTREPDPARIQSVEAPAQTTHPHDPSHFETSITTSSCSLTESSSPPNSAGLAILKAPVASRSAMVSSESLVARSASGARARRVGPMARTFSRIVASRSAESGVVMILNSSPLLVLRHNGQLHVAGVVRSGIDGIRRSGVVVLVVRTRRDSGRRIGLDVDPQPAALSDHRATRVEADLDVHDFAISERLVVRLEVRLHRPVRRRPLIVQLAMRHLEQAMPDRMDVGRIDRGHEGLVAYLAIVLVEHSERHVDIHVAARQIGRAHV